MTIKHLVVSGGAHKYMITYGILKQLYKQSFWKYDDIETIWSTSSGTLLALFICLQYEWDILDDYLIKRPWNNLLKIKADQIIDINSKNGLYTLDTLYDIITPLLLGKGLSKDITLKELYDYSKKEVHFFTTDVNEFNSIDISYKTHPDVPLIHTMYMSACIPGLCKPLCEKNKCYIDGAFIINFPLVPCLNSTKCNNEDILGIFYDSTYNVDIVDDNSKLSTLLNTLITKVQQYCNNIIKYDYSMYPNVISCNTSDYSYSDILSIITCTEERKKMVQFGCNQALEFLDNQFK